MLQTLVGPNHLDYEGGTLLIDLRQTDITFCQTGVMGQGLLQSFTSVLHTQKAVLKRSCPVSQLLIKQLATWVKSDLLQCVPARETPQSEILWVRQNVTHAPWGEKHLVSYPLLHVCRMNNWTPLYFKATLSPTFIVSTIYGHLYICPYFLSLSHRERDRKRKRERCK